jgi:Domain of unknown function (DUF4082)
VTTSRFFPTNPTPANDLLDDSAVTLGIFCAVLVDGGTVTQIKFYAPTGFDGTYTVGLYNADTNALVGSQTATGVSAGWNTVTLSSPLSVSSGINYIVCFHTSGGDYGYTASYGWPAGAGDARTASSFAGRYEYGGSIARPTNTVATNYWVDLVFDDGVTPSVTGSAANTMAAFTSTGAGSTVVGSSAKTMAAFTSSAAGALTVTGSAADTMSANTITARGRALTAFTSTYAEYVALTSNPVLYYRFGEANAPTAYNIGTVPGNGTFWHDATFPTLFHYDPTLYDSGVIKHMGGDFCAYFQPDHYDPGNCINGFESGKQASDIGVTAASGCTIEGWWLRPVSNDANQAFAGIGCGAYDGTQNAAAARGLNIYGVTKYETGDLNFHTYAVDFYSNVVPRLEWTCVGSNGHFAYIAVIYDPSVGTYGEIRVHHLLASGSWSATPAATYTLPSALSFREDSSPASQLYHTTVQAGAEFSVDYMSRGSLIDELAVYNRVLTTTELEYHFKLGSDAAFAFVTGTSAKTQAAFTSSAVGTLTVTGSASNTQAAFTSSAAGTLTVTGTASNTQAAWASVGSGTVTGGSGSGSGRWRDHLSLGIGIGL